MIDEILKYNKEFVEEKKYEQSTQGSAGSTEAFVRRRLSQKEPLSGQRHYFWQNTERQTRGCLFHHGPLGSGMEM